MIKKVFIPLGILLLGLAIVGCVLLPIPSAESRTIDLPVSRMLACPVGDAVVGKTTVTVTDQESFTIVTAEATAPETSMHAVLQNPSKPVIVRGSATVAGISSYTENDQTMMAPCAAPTTSGYWSGVVTQDAQSALILSNVDDTSAVVDVFLYDENGPITLPGLRDIPVSAGGTQMLSINQLVQSTSVDAPIGVQLRASKGRVSAILRTITAKGADWQAPSLTLETNLIIAGVPAGGGTRSLSVTNTDPSHTATVKVEVLSELGPFTPLGLEAVDIGASRSVTMDITQALGGQASAIRLTSNRPVTASVVALDQDLAGVSAQPALDGAAVLPAAGGTLWAANPDADAATVTLAYIDQDGTPQTLNTPVPGQSIAPITFPTTGDSVVVSTTSSLVRTSLVIIKGSWSIIPISGGGIVTSVNAPRLDPGLG